MPLRDWYFVGLTEVPRRRTPPQRFHKSHAFSFAPPADALLLLILLVLVVVVLVEVLVLLSAFRCLISRRFWGRLLLSSCAWVDGWMHFGRCSFQGKRKKRGEGEGGEDGEGSGFGDGSKFEEPEGGTALLVVKEGASAWTRIRQRLAEAPLFQELYRRAREAQKTKTAQSAQKAKVSGNETT
jgi:hypothetical protein